MSPDLQRSTGAADLAAFFARCGIPWILNPEVFDSQWAIKVEIRGIHISRKTSEMWGTRAPCRDKLKVDDLLWA